MKTKSNQKQAADLALFAGAFLGFTAVGLGALASHAFSKSLEIQSIALMEIGLRYQFYHALALLTVWNLIDRNPQERNFQLAGYFLFAGVIFFSGSLYIMALTGMTFMGAVTPIGGVLLLLGWLMLFLGAYHRCRSTK